MKFGNWLVTENAISWDGKTLQRFEIPCSELHATSANEKGEGVFYKWILLATDEEWLTENDLYDLNFAFVYAAGKLGKVFNYEVFDGTLEYQYEIFDSEDHEG